MLCISYCNYSIVLFVAVLMSSGLFLRAILHLRIAVRFHQHNVCFNVYSEHASTFVPTSIPNALTLFYTSEIVENSTAFEFCGGCWWRWYNDIVAAFEGVGLYWFRYPNWDKHLISLFNLSGDLGCADVTIMGVWMLSVFRITMACCSIGGLSSLQVPWL